MSAIAAQIGNRRYIIIILTCDETNNSHLEFVHLAILYVMTLLERTGLYRFLS